MHDLGPVWWQVGPIAGLEVAAVAAAAVALLTWRVRRSVS
jgi:hypothetical protein